MNKNEKEQKNTNEVNKYTTHVKLTFNIETSYSLASKITCSFNKSSSDHDITTVYSSEPDVCTVIMSKVVEMPDRRKEISKCNDIIFNQVTTEDEEANITRTEYIPFYGDDQNWSWKEMLRVNYTMYKDNDNSPSSTTDYKRIIDFLKKHNIIEGYFFFKFGEDKSPRCPSFLDLRTDSTYMFVESNEDNFRLMGSSKEFISIVIPNKKILNKLEDYLISNKRSWAKYTCINGKDNTITIEIDPDRQGTGLLRIILTKLLGFFEEFGWVDPAKLKAFLDNPIEMLKVATPCGVDTVDEYDGHSNLITINDNLVIGIKVYTILY